MEYVRLGSTGLRVSRLCLGTMTFGLQCDEQQSHAILDTAYDAGITFLDTADVYPVGGTVDTVGRTEEIIGRWMAGRRDDVIVATKAFASMSRRQWDRGTSRKHLLDGIDASLRRLGTDYVDLYQLHGDDRSTPLDETLAALDTIVQSGRARYVGCSNFLAYRLATALGRSDVRNIVRMVSVQPRYCLLWRGIERELLPLCEQEGLAVIPYNPLAGGLLSGKHQRSTAPADGTRFTLGHAGKMYTERYWHDREFDTVDALRPFADELGISLATLAVSWVLANPTVTAPIIGASKPEQLADSIAAASTPLSVDVKTALDHLTTDFLATDGF
ncbi:MAG: aldo/keto reductase [Acidimicrobiia bacterium]